MTMIFDLVLKFLKNNNINNKVTDKNLSNYIKNNAYNIELINKTKNDSLKFKKTKIIVNNKILIDFFNIIKLIKTKINSFYKNKIFNNYIDELNIKAKFFLMKKNAKIIYVYYSKIRYYTNALKHINKQNNVNHKRRIIKINNLIAKLNIKIVKYKMQFSKLYNKFVKIKNKYKKNEKFRSVYKNFINYHNYYFSHKNVFSLLKQNAYFLIYLLKKTKIVNFSDRNIAVFLTAKFGNSTNFTKNEYTNMNNNMTNIIISDDFKKFSCYMDSKLDKYNKLFHIKLYRFDIRFE